VEIATILRPAGIAVSRPNCQSALTAIKRRGDRMDILVIVIVVIVVLALLGYLGRGRLRM
jgi:hypothetical protein